MPINLPPGSAPDWLLALCDLLEQANITLEVRGTAGDVCAGLWILKQHTYQFAAHGEGVALTDALANLMTNYAKKTEVTHEG